MGAVAGQSWGRGGLQEVWEGKGVARGDAAGNRDEPYRAKCKRNLGQRYQHHHPHDDPFDRFGSSGRLGEVSADLAIIH